jgi:hypothetical protein
VDRTIFDQQVPYTKVQETKCRLVASILGKHRCFCGLQLGEVEPAASWLNRGGNLKFTSTFVPSSSETILYLLSYCSVVRLRLHSLQILRRFRLVGH